MEIKLSRALIGINALSVLTLLFVFFVPVTWLGVVLAAPFLLFGPGFALIAALVPSREAMGTTERIILGLVISIAVTPLIGLALNFSEFGITTYSVSISVSVFTYLASLVAWVRLAYMHKDDHAVITLHTAVPFRGSGRLDGLLTVIAVIFLVGAAAAAIYVSAAQKNPERFTQFYLPDAANSLVYTPDNLTVGNTGEVSLNISNHEGEKVSYRVAVYIEGVLTDEIGPITLKDGETWRGEATFSPFAPGDDQQVKFLLYRDGDGQPYLDPLYFWVDVPGSIAVGGK